jgi:hypothetical protein
LAHRVIGKSPGMRTISPPRERKKGPELERRVIERVDPSTPTAFQLLQLVVMLWFGVGCLGEVWRNLAQFGTAWRPCSCFEIRWSAKPQSQIQNPPWSLQILHLKIAKACQGGLQELQQAPRSPRFLNGPPGQSSITADAYWRRKSGSFSSQ